MPRLPLTSELHALFPTLIAYLQLERLSFHRTLRFRPSTIINVHSQHCLPPFFFLQTCARRLVVTPKVLPKEHLRWCVYCRQRPGSCLTRSSAMASKIELSAGGFPTSFSEYMIEIRDPKLHREPRRARCRKLRPSDDWSQTLFVDCQRAGAIPAHLLRVLRLRHLLRKIWAHSSKK